MIELTAGRDYERLDMCIADCLNISRTRAQNYIRERYITADTKLKPSMPVHEGQKFNADIPESANVTELKPEPDVKFEVVHEDKYLLVINKPPRLVVHPAPGNWTGTLINGVIARYPDVRRLTGWMRPGIVHRLDSGTSGLMVIARKQKTYTAMQKLFQERKVSKKYLALVHGCPARREGILSGPLAHDPENYAHMIIAEGGKPSLTGYRVLWGMNGCSLVMCELFTGRTHQIRAHLSALGCPLVGDTMYGAQNFGDVFDGRVYLHSWQLGFVHPATGEAVNFRQGIPADFREYIEAVKKRQTR